MRNTFFNSLSKETSIAVFFAITALMFLSLFFFPTETKQIIQKKIYGEKATTYPTKIPTQKVTPNTLSISLTNTQTPDEPIQTQVMQITIVITPTPAQTPKLQKATISVTIDDVNSFTVSLDPGKNQCEVLSHALSEKKISQLLMKYDSSLDSYGVYQINNLGKDNAVWWTYTVNGKNPTQGCNHIAANDGDTVSWKYIGSK